MKKKEFYITIITFAALSTALIVGNFILKQMDKKNLDWLLMFGIILIGYMYFRYRLAAPMQKFSNKFNMLMDYDLDIDGAIELTLGYVQEAPTKGMKALFEVHLGMAYYNNGEYERAIQTLNAIELKKMHNVYHILVFAHQAYAHNELGNQEGFDLALERIRNIIPQINRKFVGYANSYERLLTALKNLETDPEEFKIVVEANLAEHGGYVSQRLVYHYRMAQYWQVVNNVEEMDIHLAKILANGKSHFTTIEAQKMFKNTVNVEDYVFTEESYDDIESTDDETSQEQIEDIKELDIFDQEEDDLDNK